MNCLTSFSLASVLYLSLRSTSTSGALKACVYSKEAATPPKIGPAQYTQWLSQMPVMTAVPNVLPGFMLAPVYLMAPKWPTVTASPIANGAANFDSKIEMFAGQFFVSLFNEGQPWIYLLYYHRTHQIRWKSKQNRERIRCQALVLVSLPPTALYVPIHCDRFPVKVISMLQFRLRHQHIERQRTAEHERNWFCRWRAVQWWQLDSSDRRWHVQLPARKMKCKKINFCTMRSAVNHLKMFATHWIRDSIYRFAFTLFSTLNCIQNEFILPF